MASLNEQNTGLSFIKFFLHGRECRLHIGRVSPKVGMEAKRHIEELVDCYLNQTPVDRRTKRWLEDIPDRQHAKIAKYGLTRPREEDGAAWLSGFLHYCKREKEKHCRVTSMQVYRNAMENLRDYFGNRLLESISRHEVDEFREWLVTSANRRVPGTGLSPSTANKRLKTCREWFEIAVKKGWIRENPFDHLKGLESGVTGPTDRKVFVSRAIVNQLIANSNDTEWRLLIVLWRFAGLRQLEPFELTWHHISWATNRMTVLAPKQNAPRKRTRVIPIWPEVHPWLTRQFEEAPEGELKVIWRRRYAYDTDPDSRSTASALYSRLERQCLQLGIPTWPRLTHNLRASGETELEQTGLFRQWEIAYWWNHNVRIQTDHYLMMNDDAFDRAERLHQLRTEKPGKKPDRSPNQIVKDQTEVVRGRLPELHLEPVKVTKYIGK